MVPTRLSVSHWPARSSTSRFSAVVRGASFGNGVLFDFCIFQRCVRLELRQCAGLVTLGRHVGHFPHNPLELGRLFGLLLVVKGDFLAKFAWIRHFCCCCSGAAALLGGHSLCGLGTLTICETGSGTVPDYLRYIVISTGKCLIWVSLPKLSAPTDRMASESAAVATVNFSPILPLKGFQFLFTLYVFVTLHTKRTISSCSPAHSPQVLPVGVVPSTSPSFPYTSNWPTWSSSQSFPTNPPAGSTS